MIITREELKARINEVIDQNAAEIIRLGDEVFAAPELGYKEFRTSDLAAETLARCGLTPERNLAVTGVRAVLRGTGEGPRLALLGEMDALPAPDHPQADPDTKAAHACGHNAQMAGLLGAALALTQAKAAEYLAGAVVFFAVPAEEYVDLDFRAELARRGEIKYFGGKPELIRQGHFDDVDLALMIHTHGQSDYQLGSVAESSNGFVVKNIKYRGRSAHAGAAPHRGVNALSAARVALTAIDAQRDTFRDQDHVRVHHVITHGGDAVNAVPAEVRLENVVRGRTLEAVRDAAEKVDRAFRAGAMALGAKVEIATRPGYLPLVNDPGMKEVFRDNCLALFGPGEFGEAPHRSGSTDMGDVSQIMPALHPYVAGAAGAAHGGDWRLVDKELAYLAPARLLAMTAVDLLWGDGEKARRIVDGFQPKLSRAEYFKLLDDWQRREMYDGVGGKSEFF